ncbi:hypothetical protein EDB81DRAFT_194800 [Dactylonectria macrodidyma]|uniref:Mitochondrial outer membrane protein OM14 C-terminal domain-containing protein n=1 Tax=Dactylonectria macrodidyma TaxID=307937 RepID=A0A9P9JQ36_9HYPO|nr:hypothetical protein EDB81DRAFT_194800 [Dactylonectria macrodidyma]
MKIIQSYPTSPSSHIAITLPLSHSHHTTFQDFPFAQPSLSLRTIQSPKPSFSILLIQAPPFNPPHTTITMSYADVAASGPKQSPEEAAAPQPVEVVNTESASTASLVDVDMPSVHTVHSDFLEQEVQTQTQADRIAREEDAAKAKAKAEKAKSRAASKAKSADDWLSSYFAGLSDNTASAVVVANLASVVGISAFLGYKAWGLHQQGRLSGRSVGLGVGIVAGVAAVEAFVGRYLYKGKKGGSS